MTAQAHLAASAAEADSFAAAALARRQIPGLALVVLQGDDVLLARGYGQVEIGRPISVSETTVFQLGSISKPFLAALILALSADKAVSLDDPAARYFPEAGQLPPDLLVRHLLNHTSGLREIFTLPEAQTAYDDLTRSREELAAVVLRAPVDFRPSTRWSYSNTNYLLLALLVERLAGRPYEQVLAERFFGPLGLASLGQCRSLPQGPAESQGHVLRGGAVVPAAPENMNWIRGDGGLCGHAVDVARWMRGLGAGRILAPDLYEQMIAPARLADGRLADYGMGVSLIRPDGARKVAHNGAMRGFSASAAYYPDAALTVVVLANRGGVTTESIERGVARRLLSLPRPLLSERPLPAEERQRLAGTYDIGVFEVSVAERGGRLWLEMPPPGPTTPLIHLGGGAFAGEADAEAIRLDFSGESPAREVRLLMAAMHWYGERLSPRSQAMPPARPEPASARRQRASR